CSAWEADERRVRNRLSGFELGSSGVPMPTRKGALAPRGLAWLLIAVIGATLASTSADATPLMMPESATQSRVNTTKSTKHLTKRTRRLLAMTRACRGNHRLQMGIASWYGGKAFYRTASGETFRANELAAASRTLPFNTRGRVTNLHNGRSIVVRINDRGPFVHDRIIDVTPRAAIDLGMKTHGTAPVYLEIVRRETQSAIAGQTEFKKR
ncbi:MAG: septal ring lytic transglycosylase RlpA family protein, partial [Vulcanimicrobiaceae bacterium]